MSFWRFLLRALGSFCIWLGLFLVILILVFIQLNHQFRQIDTIVNTTVTTFLVTHEKELIASFDQNGEFQAVKDQCEAEGNADCNLLNTPEAQAFLDQANTGVKDFFMQNFLFIPNTLRNMPLIMISGFLLFLIGLLCIYIGVQFSVLRTAANASLKIGLSFLSFFIPFQFISMLTPESIVNIISNTPLGAGSPTILIELGANILLNIFQPAFVVFTLWFLILSITFIVFSIGFFIWKKIRDKKGQTTEKKKETKKSKK